MEAHVYGIGERFFNFEKLLIFGDKNVGKSTFLKRISKADFDSHYDPSTCKDKLNYYYNNS
jgi:GTPase SAR1 family protein